MGLKMKKNQETGRNAKRSAKIGKWKQGIERARTSPGVVYTQPQENSKRFPKNKKNEAAQRT
jgi:hypothetical protein